MHLVCLVVQVSSNFGFIKSLDAQFPNAVPHTGLSFLDNAEGLKLTTIAATTWALYLSCCAAPIPVRLVALASLYAGYSAAELMLAKWEVVSALAGVLTVVVLK